MVEHALNDMKWYDEHWRSHDSNPRFEYIWLFHVFSITFNRPSPQNPTASPTAPMAAASPLSATFALVAAKGSPELLASVDFLENDEPKNGTKCWNKIVLLCRKKLSVCVSISIYWVLFCSFCLSPLRPFQKGRAFLKSIALQLPSSSSRKLSRRHIWLIHFFVLSVGKASWSLSKAFTLIIYIFIFSLVPYQVEVSVLC